MNELNLEKFRTVFLKSDGWQVSDCYKTYDDKFLRKDAQDAYEGAKWAWQEQQAKIDELQARVDATEKWIESNKKNIPLSEWHGYTTEEYVDADDLLEILKGNKDEN